MNPLKSSMKTVTQAVKTMPDNMLSTVDGVMDKLFGSTKKHDVIYESVKVGAGLDTEVSKCSTKNARIFLVYPSY